MKSLALIFILCAAPALAAEPTSLVLPVPLVARTVQYLASRPYSEVASMIGEVQACGAEQVPNANGAIISRGDCPGISPAAALKAAPDGGASGVPTARSSRDVPSDAAK